MIDLSFWFLNQTWWWNFDVVTLNGCNWAGMKNSRLSTGTLRRSQGCGVQVHPQGDEIFFWNKAKNGAEFGEVHPRSWDKKVLGGSIWRIWPCKRGWWLKMAIRFLVKKKVYPRENPDCAYAGTNNMRVHVVKSLTFDKTFSRFQTAREGKTDRQRDGRTNRHRELL